MTEMPFMLFFGNDVLGDVLCFFSGVIMKKKYAIHRLKIIFLKSAPKRKPPNKPFIPCPSKTGFWCVFTKHAFVKKLF